MYRESGHVHLPEGLVCDLSYFRGSCDTVSWKGKQHSAFRSKISKLRLRASHSCGLAIRGAK